MFINNNSYNTDLKEINSLRYVFSMNYIRQNSYTDELCAIIGKHIESLSVDFDIISHRFAIKIKKTTMKRIPGFIHDPNFYYSKVADIFYEFIWSNKDEIYNDLISIGANPEDIFKSIEANRNILANICYISCIEDNIIFLNIY